ncbi:MAG: chemotaxis protein CheW [Spirochaetota bacterium]
MITGQSESATTGPQRQSTLFASQHLDGEEQAEDIDFKMVTFSLGGKDYGVDIMKVKEIAKFENFTYVPNTQPFVVGVYNLRGDIISVIDMRTLFNLAASQHGEGETQDGLILRLENGLIGVVVDRIDRVVGISSETIQPPHPIFADVNMKYISGVVEHDERLYIILDVERILGERADEDTGVPTQAPAEPASKAQADARERTPAAAEPGQSASVSASSGAETAEMVAPTLRTLSGFTMTDLNRSWVEQRLQAWTTDHGGAGVSSPEEVEEFLAPFYSPFSGRFFEEGYLQDLRAVLPDDPGGVVNVWNPGCGAGYETYSLAALLRTTWPDARIKIWAGDNDLLGISNAPNLVFDRRAIPDYYEPFIVEGSNGYSFNSDIKQIVLFEFSDVTHGSAAPPCELIVIRDVLSFLSERDQRRVITEIEEKAREGTIIVPGANEDLSAMGPFVEASHGSVRAYRLP